MSCTAAGQESNRMYLEKVQGCSSVWVQVMSLTGKCGMYSRTGPG